MAGVGGQVYGYFRERGLSPQADAGILGNTQQESNTDPNAPGGGLFQDIGGRGAGPGASLRAQLDKAWQELSGPYRGTLNQLRHARSPQEAARIFSQGFERPGIPMLSNRERYAAEALANYAHGAFAGPGGGGVAGTPGMRGIPGSPAVSGAGAGGGVALTAGQLTDLMGLMDQLGQKGGSSLSAEGVLPRRPTEIGAGPPKVEAPPQEPATNPADLLSLIDKIGEDASTAEAPSAVGLPGLRGVPGTPGGRSGEPGTSGAGYVNPLPGFKLSRTDMGVDASASPGTPIRAMGNAKILGIQQNWYSGQPYLYYELLDGPRKGEVQYVAEQITPTVRPGQRVKAGDTIARYAPSGTGIETGLGTRGWQTQAQAEGRTGDVTHGNAPAGIRERKILEALGAH